MYKQLTSEQRYTIFVLLQRKCTKKEIAHAIGVSNSTITRELRRNSCSRGVYKWDKAQRQSEKCKRQMPGNRSIKPFVREMAIGLLKQRQWSHKAIYTQIIAYKTSQGERHWWNYCQNQYKIKKETQFFNSNWGVLQLLVVNLHLLVEFAEK